MKILRSTFQGVAAAATLVLGTMHLGAQTTTGSIGGRVIGASGEGVDNAQIQIVNGATGSTVSAKTRGDGNYIVVGLEIGDQYRVTVRRIGFEPRTIQPVRVNLGQTTPVNFTLNNQAAQLAAVTVEAAAEGALIAPSQKGAVTTITDTLLRKLPSLTRTFTDFVALTPQVSTNGPGLSGGGANNRYNNIQIDGATEKDLFGLGSTGQPGGQAGGKSIGLEAVKEYQVQLAPYDVRVGNFAGVSINAVTKSGTNTYTGSAYTYYRNQSLQRSQDYLGDFNSTQFGFGLGGPIVKDKAFFYINPEWQSKAVPAGGPALGDAGTKVTDALIQQFNSALTSRGMSNLGDGSRVNNQNPLSNIFVRFDFALPWNSTLVLRDNYAHAEQQVFSRGASGATPSFGLTSYLYHFTSDKQAPVAQFRTNFSNGSYNEAIAAYTRIRDQRATPGTLQPAVTVFVNGTAQLFAGTENSSQANALDQDVLELTDNYTMPIGAAHRLTLGAQGQWYKVRNLFGQNLVGLWTFGSLDSLAAGTPRQYQVGVPVCPNNTTCDGAVRFKAGQFAAYAQDDWTATPNLNFTLGVRLDEPVFFTKPPSNPTIITQFGRNTADVPSGNIQISPRFGFNWNVTGDDRNQVRGGAGVFQGSPAYVWLANSFQNSGGISGFASLNCGNPGIAPAFTAAAVAHAPTACSNGTTAAAGSEVDLLRKDLKFPQTMRGNLAYDRDLGHGYVFGVEGIFTKFMNSLYYTNIALPDAPTGTSFDGRQLYGTAPGAPAYKVSGRNTVYDVQNESKDHSYNLTASLQKRFTTNFGGQLAYTYSQAYDVQSLTSSTAGSQYRFGQVYSGAQTDLVLAHSAWETPHRIVGDVSYTLKTKTSLSVIYTGQSGLNFAYISSNDLNADGQTLNDPIYVPTGTSDPKFPTFVTSGSVTASPQDQATAFNNFIGSTPCLNSQRGHIMTRNSCQTPWTNEFDISVEQALRTIRGQNLSLRLDVINFTNLLNKNWGRQITTSNYNPVTLYTSSAIVLPGTTTTAGANLTNGVPRATFDPGFNPFTYNNVFSNYGMQVSFRYSF
jgi:Carboxypeptidase regulatory-like domain/TonB dependent receptor-like, beta-barrel